MNSQDLEQYIALADEFYKPWLLLQLRLTQLQERRDQLSPAEYEAGIVELHTELMKLGEWWKGREDEVFG